MFVFLDVRETNELDDRCLQNVQFLWQIFIGFLYCCWICENRLYGYDLCMVVVELDVVIDRLDRGCVRSVSEAVVGGFWFINFFVIFNWFQFRSY